VSNSGEAAAWGAVGKELEVRMRLLCVQGSTRRARAIGGPGLQETRVASGSWDGSGRCADFVHR
jgi:hypothetical protein